jgi:TonB family protein
MTRLSHSFARTSICALAALLAAGITLTSAVTTVQAAPMDGWTNAVNARIHAVMEMPAKGQTGVAHVKFTVAPDGSISDAVVVKGDRNCAIRRAALRTISALGTLPTVPGATVPMRISMVLQFVGSPSEIKKINASTVQFAGLMR